MGDSVSGILDIFRSLFSGNTTFYGVHKYHAAKEGQKAEGKSRTESKQLRKEHYQSHLEGKSGLGVCPLRQDNTCAFGAVDVDVYNDAICYSYVRAIYKWNLPLLPFRTKSGGLHLYVFFQPDPGTFKYPAGSEVIRLLLQLAAIIGIDRSEIFPKQSIIQVGKLGNWINLPYYNTDNSRQYLIDKNNNRTPISEALEIIQSKQETIGAIQTSLDSLPFADGPPCLQKITVQGGPGEGGRNVWLFNSALYFKEKDHSNFDVMLDDLNDNSDDPIDADELLLIKKSAIKQEYNYACHESPLCDHCDKDKCSTKKYGVGKSGGLFMGVTLGKLTIKKGKGTVYAWDIGKDGDEGIIYFDSPKDLMNQDNFIAAILDKLHYKVTRIKAEKYDKILNSALEIADIQELDISDDNTLEGRVAKLILKYITTSLSNKDMDIERGMAFLWEHRKQILFRSDDAWKYITETNKQRNVKNSDFQEVLRKLGMGAHSVKKVSGRAIRVRIAEVADVEKLIGGPIEPLEDINFETEAEAAKEDY